MGRGSKSRRKSRTLKESAWVIDIKECLRSGQCYYNSGSSWTIYRVPRNMREVQRMAYIPKIISIGPFHYKDQRLRAMEEHKMRYLLRLLGCESTESNGNNRASLELEDLEMAIKDMEKDIRECYSESFGIRSNEFVKMMVVDGCFLVELLRLYYKFDEDENVDDPIFTTRWMLRTLQRDLSMLENQLPFFVLQKLFKLTSTSQEPSLVELIVTFFDPLLPRTDCISKLNPKEESYDHMLDVFRSTFLSSVKGKVTKSDWKQLQSTNSLSLVQERQLIHSATELQEAGLKFRKNITEDLLDITFKTRVLQIPTLYIDDNTVPLLLNFVAYEQCDEDADPYFTNYFMFFDSLINSSDDVEILHKNGIINHVLGSDKDVANLFNKLCREIVYDLDVCYLSKQMKEVNNYCKAYHAKEWHVWLSNLKSDYFSSPWTFLSLLAAIVLLLLTAVQTFYTVYPYYNK